MPTSAISNLSNPSCLLVSPNTTNQGLASLVEFIGRSLIEKNFFQNSSVSMTTLIYLANDLIKMLNNEYPKKQPKKMSLYKEFSIMGKQITGKELTSEEQAYDGKIHEIDVMGEALNGIRYAASFSILQNLYKTVSSTITQGLWEHAPALIGSATAITTGPYLIATAIEKVLNKINLSAEQKNLIKPWLNTVGRLALAFTPRVQANESGVSYQYPSTEGHTELFQNVQVPVSQDATNLLPDKPGATMPTENAEFKLHRLQLGEHETIEVVILDKNNKKIKLGFSLNENQNAASSDIVDTALSYLPSQYAMANFAVAFGTQQLVFNSRTPGFSNIFLPALFSLASPIFAQASAPSKDTFMLTYGGPYQDEARAVSVTDNGDYVIVGDIKYPNGTYGAIATSISQNGTLQWQQTITSAGNHFWFDTEKLTGGTYCLTGGSPGGTLVNNIFVNGTLNWSIAFGVPGLGIKIKSLENNTFFATGIIFLSTYRSAYITEFNSTGHMMWGKTLDFGSRADGVGAHRLPDNSIIASGTVYDSAFTTANCTLTKLNPNKTVNFTQMFGGKGGLNLCINMEITPTQTILAAGSTNSFGGGFLLTEFDFNGTLLLAKVFYLPGGELLYGIGQLTDGWVFAGPGTDFAFLKVDKNFNLIRAATLGGSATEIDSMTRDRKISILPDGRWVITGSTQSFGSGDGDALLAILNEDGLIPDCLFSKDITSQIRVTDVTANLTVTSGNVIIQDWNPAISTYPVQPQFTNPTTQLNCHAVETPTSTPIPTQTPTNNPTTSSMSSTSSQPKTGRDSSANNAGMMAGIAIAGICMGGGLVTAGFFAHRRRKQRMKEYEIDAAELAATNTLSAEQIQTAHQSIRESGSGFFAGKQIHHAPSAEAGGTYSNIPEGMNPKKFLGQGSSTQQDYSNIPEGIDRSVLPSKTKKDDRGLRH